MEKSWKKEREEFKIKGQEIFQTGHKSNQIISSNNALTQPWHVCGKMFRFNVTLHFPQERIIILYNYHEQIYK